MDDNPISGRSSIGQRIMEYIIEASLFRVENVEGCDNHVITWSANTASQLTALVNEWAMKEMKKNNGN